MCFAKRNDCQAWGAYKSTLTKNWTVEKYYSCNCTKNSKGSSTLVIKCENVFDCMYVWNLLNTTIFCKTKVFYHTVLC